MTDRIDFMGTIQVLTQEHKKAIHTQDGIEFHDVPALLDQLRDAVFGGMEKTGGSAGSKAKLPMSEAAADLLALIDQQIAEAWALVHGRVPGLEQPHRLATEWATAVDLETVVVVTHPEQHEKWDDARGRMVPFVIRAREEHHPIELARRWVHLIEDFFDPERTASIKAPCIQCAAEKVTRRKDGQDVTTDALVFRRDKDTGETLDARCLACGVLWPPAQFEFLINALELDANTAVVTERASRAVSWSGSLECFEGRHAECTSLNCRCDCHVGANQPDGSEQ